MGSIILFNNLKSVRVNLVNINFYVIQFPLISVFLDKKMKIYLLDIFLFLLFEKTIPQKASKVLLEFNYTYVIYLFNIVTFFDDVRNRFLFGTFELHMQITLQLRFAFVRHCNVLFITSQLRYLLVRCSYVF